MAADDAGRITDYKDLDVWQLAMAIARQVYRATTYLPPSERYGLASQMQNAAVSIASNIAEGYERGSTADYSRFVRMARASAAELETQMLLVRDLDMLPSAGVCELLSLIERERKMLGSLTRALDRKRKG